jgi:hypothetical protein
MMGLHLKTDEVGRGYTRMFRLRRLLREGRRVEVFVMELVG